MEHPEEIYKDFNGKELSEPERLWGEGINRRRSYDLGHEAGYAKCLADRSDPLAGYSNLTEAISAGEPIDYEKLDGKKVQCVHSEMGTLHRTLKRDTLRPPGVPTSWLDGDKGRSYSYALIDAWRGENGWTLYVEGDIPLIRKTADQLKVGTYFYGEAPSGGPDLVYVGGSSESSKAVYYTPEMFEAISPASEWVVLEEYGPFQKPEDK